ncbi:MAG: hypothetical protein ACI87W_003403 [Halieaceae bacterium]
MSAEEQTAVEEAGTAFGQVMGGLQQAAKELEAGDIDSAGEAGAALGALFGQIAATVNEGQQQRNNAKSVLQQVPDLATADIATLTPLGSIEQPSARYTLLFAVNDDGETAPLTGPVRVYRDSGGLRYPLRMSSGYLPGFSSLEDQQRGLVESAGEATTMSDAAGATKTVNVQAGTDRVQNIEVRNAGIYIYDESGVVVGGDECEQSVV